MVTAMKERPILFSAPMVCAILDGQKTQTRRVISPPVFWWQNADYPNGVWVYSNAGKVKDPAKSQYTNSLTKGWPDTLVSFCPFGNVGDRLWVRETFFDNNCPGYGTPGTPDYAPPERNLDCVYYRADWPIGSGPDFEGETIERDGGGWKPSIHMPRWASRITLEITQIRAQKLQDITEDDAKAEGVARGWYLRDTPDGEETVPTTYRDGFKSQWNQIFGGLNLTETHGWDANPWVFVIHFKVAESEATK